MRSGGASKSQCASITSSPLFIIVAESTEILRPMTQFGWAHASAGVTAASASGAASRKGPPEAVRRMRRTPDLVEIAAKVPRQRLENGVVFAVDGQQHRPVAAHGIDEHRARHDQRFLVGEQHLLPGLRCGKPGPQSSRPDDGGHHAADFWQTAQLRSSAAAPHSTSVWVPAPQPRKRSRSAAAARLSTATA